MDAQKTQWIWKPGFGWVKRDVEAARILEGDVEQAA